jgi:hypothetical protein
MNKARPPVISPDQFRERTYGGDTRVATETRRSDRSRWGGRRRDGRRPPGVGDARGQVGLHPLALSSCLMGELERKRPDDPKIGERLTGRRRGPASDGTDIDMSGVVAPTGAGQQQYTGNTRV